MNIFSELMGLMELTKLLKMSSFPVVMLESNWKDRYPSQILQAKTRRTGTKLEVTPASITPLRDCLSSSRIPQSLNGDIVLQRANFMTKESVLDPSSTKDTQIQPNNNSSIDQKKASTNNVSILLPKDTRLKRQYIQKNDCTNGSEDQLSYGSSCNNETTFREDLNVRRKISILRSSRSRTDISNKKPKISLLQSTYHKSNTNPRHLTETQRQAPEDISDNLLNKEDILRDEGKDMLVEMAHINSVDGLGNLVSVAEAFEKSQKPDFNDVLSPILNGTDTEKVLVRNCVICKKQLLGRNAYGRHMKNVHSKFFGPYQCPEEECSKKFESGYSLMQHMYTHIGPRGRAFGKFYVQILI